MKFMRQLALSILMEGYVEKNKLISLRGTIVLTTTKQIYWVFASTG